jgi:hypothetical protein
MVYLKFKFNWMTFCSLSSREIKNSYYSPLFLEQFYLLQLTALDSTVIVFN